MKDDYEINWDSDDMFDGDYDFDTDFDMDPNAKKSFLGGFASGFLTGITDGTVGTTDAKIKSLRTILPNTWSTALDKAEFLHSRYQDLKTEFQQENAQTFKSLQNIAGRLSDKMSDKLPNFVNDGLDNFSQKDFSQWEKLEDGGPRLNNMDDASDDETEWAQDRALQAQSSMFSSLGDSLNSMTAAATASLQSTIMGGNRQLVNIEGGIRDMLAYQRNVQARMDQAMLNLTARQYVQSSKFYKFMEAGVHEEVRQLKLIAKNTKMSEYEKQNLLTASKQALRDGMIGAVGKRMGGLGEFVSTRLGAGARKDMYGAFGSLVGGVEMAGDMGVTELSKGTIGDMLGQMVAGVAIEQLPFYFSHGPGKKIIDTMMKNNPKQAKWIRGQVKQLKDLGNVVSYVSTSGVGMVNRMADNYQAMDEMKFYDYDEYLQSLGPGEKPIPKSLWKITNSAQNVMKSKINSFMADVGKARGTLYTIDKRDPKKLAQPGQWKEMNNITLNEVIPGLISQTNQILEQIRTGRDDVEKVSYNYMRGQFMTESDRKITTKADLMVHADFKNIASAALNMVEGLDPRKMLSAGAKKALAMQIAKDVDAEKAFNPFYYLGNIPGVSPTQLKEIHAVMKLHFGIEDQDVTDFENADSFGKLKIASNMPTRRGRDRLAQSALAAENIKNNYPNIADRINLLRQTGNEQMLRDLGIIYNDNGVDKINADIFHDRIGQYMDDPNQAELRGVVTGGTRGTNAPTRGLGLGGQPAGPAPVIQVGGQEELTDTLKQLTERLSGLADKADQSSKRGELVNFDPMTGELSAIKDINQGILGKSTEMAETMAKLYDLAAEGKLLMGKISIKEEKEEENAKLSIWKAVKSKFPPGMLSSGMEFLANNSPLVLGGLLGGISTAFVSNPIAAAAVAGTGLLAGAVVQYWGHKDRLDARASSGRHPSDDEDILDDKGEPLLYAETLKAGQYLDAVTRRVIKTWKDIKGPIYDAGKKVVIGIGKLGGAIFGPDGRAVMLSGITKAKNAAVSAYNFLDPINRIKSALGMGKAMIYQQDVYVRGDSEPRLLSIKFKSGEYFIRDDSNTFKAIEGWNEINGPVYDEEGNQLVTQEEYEAGLITATGAAVRNVGATAANMAGMAAGLGKAGLDSLLGKFGYSKPQGNVGAAGGAGGSAGSSSGVERRLDRIYKLLEKQFGISVEDDYLDAAMAGASAGGSTGGNSSSSTSPFRLNSLSFKAKQKQEEEKHEVNKAIIKIAKNTEGLGEGDGKDDEKGGIFSKLKSFIGGIATFGMNLIKNPLGTIGGLIFGSLVKSTGRLAKIGSLMFSGVLGLASPIYKLMKWGFSSLAKAFMGGKMAKTAFDMLEDGPDIDIEPEQHGQSGKKDKEGKEGKDKQRKGKNKKGPGKGRGRNRRVRSGGGRTQSPASRAASGADAATRRPRAKPGNRLGKMKLGNPMAMATGTALSWALGSYMDDGTPASVTEAADISIGERDPITGHYRTGGDALTEALTSYLPQGQLAKGLVDNVVGADTMKKMDNYGLFWSTDGKFYFNRSEMEKHEDEVRGIVKDESGYGLIKDFDKPSRQRALRVAMYGVRNVDSHLGRRILLLEKLLYPWVVLRGEKASLKPDTPIEKILTQFTESAPQAYDDYNAISGWYTARFKPIFLMFNAAVAAARMGDLDEFDNAKNFTVVQVVTRVQEAIATMDPFPYNIDQRIDSTEGIMNEELTRHTVTAILERLQKDFPAPKEEVEKIATDKTLEKKLDTQGTPVNAAATAEQAAQDTMGKKAALASQQAIDAKFQQPANVTEIDIKDLLPGDDAAMDPFTMVRLAAYGNIDNMPWRVAAVLRLERYMENFIMVMGNDARFTGKSGQILELFKASFRIDTDIAANNWMTWFRDRFLPVLMTYVKAVKKYKGTMPATGWKSLSATNRAQIAHSLTAQLITVNDQQVSIWEVEASPFPSSKSGKWADRANKYLEILDAKAMQARLRDPELEDMNSRSVEEKDPQKFAQEQAETKEKAKQTAMDMQNKAAGTSPAMMGAKMPGFGGGNQTAMSQGGYYPNATMSAPGGPAGSAGEFMGKANENFNPEFIKKAGEDKGVKMSLEQGEKLMLNHLVKAGFKDNKTLALALAMARKETGNYQSTVENTNWSAPTLLKYFKNVPDAATAQKVAAMSPAERAMWVYGRAPKGPQLGNSKPEDGWDYRGRGFFQLTGKANYEKFKKDTGIDVVGNPKLVSEDPNVMAESAVWYLKNNAAMKSIAKTGDFDTAVRGINGGNAVPATDERRAFYNDYLNKLRSGDMDLGDTSGAAEDPDAADPMTAGKAPVGADQNAPPEQVSGQAAVQKDPKPGESAAEIIAKNQQPPSNVGSTESASASPLDPSVKGTAAANNMEAEATSAAVEKASSTSPGSTSTGTASPAPTEKVTKAASSKPAEPLKAEVNIPDNLKTTDEAVAGMLGQTNQLLAQLVQGQKKDSSGGIVDMR